MPEPFDPENPRHLTIARGSPAGWAWACGGAHFRFPPHIKWWNDMALGLSGGNLRLLLEAPVRHAKSEFWDLWVASWFLGCNPDARVVVSSYAASLPARTSRLARDAMERLGPAVFGQSISDVSASATDWSLDGHLRGGYFVVGVGGGLMGRGADLLLLDDLLDQQGALSDVQRETCWEWLEGNALARLEPNASVVGVSTRYHADDMHGRLLKRHPPGSWEHLCLPALALENDPLGRKPGEALWPERYPAEVLEALKASKPPYWWAALYQGDPIPEGGGILKPDWWRDTRYQTENGQIVCQDGYRVPLSDLHTFAVVDTALTERKLSDYTVIVAAGIAPDRRLVILDVDRRRIDAPDIVPAVQSMLARWRIPAAWVERSTASLTQISLLRRAGVQVRQFGKAGDVSLLLPSGGGSDPKVPTYHAAAPMIEARRLWLPASASWLADVEAEMGSVPYSVTGHDDAAEAVSVACILADHLSPGAPLWARGESKSRRVPDDVRHTIPRDEAPDPRWAGTLNPPSW